MPCWYFDRVQIKNSPSLLDGIDTNTENRYRREGARFIIDAGTKMGLRWDTFATGVIYFHRFYMFHSFKEFYRYVTAACCLFLAGKVEETPKKCKDIIKIAQNLLSSSSFLKFGEDPREEVMTMERILLKTIKFDLQVEHPYAFLLKYAKSFKSEEDKVQNMAQMAWTFMNDSLCTTLCLQWEPEIVGVSLMYLASRFTKFEPSDWSGRSSTRSKWWNDFVDGMTIELMEDIGHQMLDLYSHKNRKVLDADSPPTSPSKANKGQSTPPPPPPDRPPPKRNREDVKSESEPPVKSSSVEKEPKVSAPVKSEPDNNASTTASNDSVPPVGAPIPVAQHRTPSSSYNRDRDRDRERGNSSYKSSSSDRDTYSSYNPYVSSRMLSSSFMSQEGSQNIQSILAGNTVPPHPSSIPAYPEPQNPPLSHHNLPDTSQYPPPSTGPHNPTYSYLPPPPQSQYGPPPSIPPPHSYPPPSNPPPGFDPYAPPPTTNPNFLPPTTYAPPPVSIAAPQHSYVPPALPQSHSYNFPPTHLPPPGMPPPRPSSYPPPGMPYHGPSDHHQGFGGVSRNYGSGPPPGGNARNDLPALTEVKISGRSDWNMNR